MKKKKKTSYRVQENTADHKSNKGLVSGIYKIQKLKPQQEKKRIENKQQFNRKLAKDMKRYFNIDDIQIINEHMKSCSTTLGKCKIKLQ